MPGLRGTKRQLTTTPKRGSVPRRRLEADASRTVRPNVVAAAARAQHSSARSRGATGAVPSGAGSSASAPLRAPRARRSATETLALILNAVIVALAAGVIFCGTLLVLRNTTAFTIENLEVTATDHLAGDDVARLANIGEGTTLLNVDTAAIERRVAQDPWVSSVSVRIELPDTLVIEVTERSVTEVVLMSSGSLAWYVGDGDVWIEPVSVTAANGRSASETALDMALEMGSLLVTDVPATVSPQAGAVVTDESLLAVAQYLEELPSELSEQIASFSAPSADAISCVLSSGIEVSLGSPNDIASKGAIVLQLIAEHPGEITYINVRSVSDPSYRKISSDSVQPGTGMVSSSDDSEAEDAASSDEVSTSD